MTITVLSMTEPGAVTFADCVRWSEKEERCSILNHTLCPARCKSFTDDPYQLLKELDDLISYSKGNAHRQANLRKERKRVIRKWSLRPDDWYAGYLEDQNRGSGGGHSEGDTSNSAASMKQKMKDNRPVECKQTAAEREAVKEATQQWEEQNGKLEKLGRSSMSRSKVDSYTGESL